MKVLIIEDSPSQSAIIAEVVRALGHEPIVYNQLPTGIAQLLVTDNPDLVLLDLRLLDSEGKQVGDGFQMCREIKRSRQSLPVVVITAEGDEEASEWAELQGADAFLQKPFNPQDLAAVIDQICGGS